MNDDLLAQFAQMQKYMSAMHNMINRAQAYAPREAKGADETGTVTVVLGPNGLPASYRFVEDWDEHVRPEELGNAVVEAFQAAVTKRMAQWSETLEEADFQDEIDRLKRGVVSDRERVPEAFQGKVPEVDNPRPLSEITEDVLGAFNNIDSFAGAPPTDTATGTDESESVTVTLSATGLTSCTVNVRWAERATATRLMVALTQATDAAKKELSSEARKRNRSAGLDRLIAEAMARLSNPATLGD